MTIPITQTQKRISFIIFILLTPFYNNILHEESQQYLYLVCEVRIMEKYCYLKKLKICFFTGERY
ncbi:predicted protein [Enterococcus faecium Com12]|nr:predicted protein [Enterococcus faecium Com12]